MKQSSESQDPRASALDALVFRGSLLVYTRRRRLQNVADAM